MPCWSFVSRQGVASAVDADFVLIWASRLGPSIKTALSISVCFFISCNAFKHVPTVKTRGDKDRFWWVGPQSQSIIVASLVQSCLPKLSETLETSALAMMHQRALGSNPFSSGKPWRERARHPWVSPATCWLHIIAWWAMTWLDHGFCSLALHPFR